MHSPMEGMENLCYYCLRLYVLMWSYLVTRTPLCVQILTMHDVCALRLALLSVYIAVAVCKAPHYLCVDVVVEWVPCNSHSSLCTYASCFLLVATTFKCQDGISCLCILTTHDVCALRLALLSVYIAVADDASVSYNRLNCLSPAGHQLASTAFNRLITPQLLRPHHGPSYWQSPITPQLHTTNHSHGPSHRQSPRSPHISSTGHNHGPSYR